MRIALIAPFGLGPKGTVSARMLPLAHALARRGHSVRVIIPPWDDPAAGGNGDRQTKHEVVPAGSNEGEQLGGVHVATLPLPARAPYSLALTHGLVKWALWPPRPTGNSVSGNKENRDAARALQTFKAEVAHVFKPVGYSGLAGLALSALRAPWVLDTDDWEGPGGWADVNPYSPAQKLALALQDALLPRMAGAVTTASRTLEARAWSFGLPRERVFYMPNGVWREKYGAWAGFSRRARGGPTILLYTRFAEFPYQWPLDVLERVKERHPNAKLLVVGGGFFGEEEKLRAEAERRGMSSYVVVVGRVKEEDVPAYLALGDVALYPMEDNLINRAKSPVKVLEPMVMGLPIVAHRVGQAAEFIGDAGVLVEPGDLRGMAEAVSALLSDPERRERLGEKARERVWGRFNWEELCVVAEEAYRAAMKAKNVSKKRLVGK